MSDHDGALLVLALSPLFVLAAFAVGAVLGRMSRR